MSRLTIVLLIILIVLTAVLVALYFIGKRMQKKQAESETQIQANKKAVKMLIIDKKKLKLKDSGLSEQIISQTPWYAKRSKVPIVKAKIGANFQNFICDEKVFDDIPVKKQPTLYVSGLYIVGIKDYGRGGRPQSDGKPRKKSLLEKLQEKAGANPVK